MIWSRLLCLSLFTVGVVWTVLVPSVYSFLFSIVILLLQLFLFRWKVVLWSALLALPFYLHTAYTAQFMMERVSLYEQLETIRGDWQVKSMPIAFEGGFRATVELVSSPSLSEVGDDEFQLVVFTDDPLPKWTPTATICSASFQFESPSRTTVPGTFPEEAYMKSIGVVGTVVANEVPVCQQTQRLPTLETIRYAFLQKIDNTYQEDVAATVKALVFGDRSSLDEEQVAAFQTLGLSHILAISGLHVGIFSLGCLQLLLRLGLPRVVAMIGLGGILLSYTIIAGGAPSVQRAVGMTVLAFLAWPIRHKVHPVSIWSICLLLLLWLDPFLLLAVGFQLSFAVSLILVLSSQSLLASTSHAIWVFIRVSLLAQVGSLPLLLLNFYTYSPYSLIANFIFVPVYTLFLIPVSFLLTIAAFVLPSLGSVLSTGIQFLNGGLQWAVQAIKGLPFSSVTFGAPSFVELFLLVVAVVLAIQRFEWDQYAKGVEIVLFALFVQIMGFFSAPMGEVTMIDVEQGDSLFVRMPYDGGTFIVDTGGYFLEEDRYVEDRILPFLKQRGVRELDALIVTHEDIDHSGGIETLLQNMYVKELIVAEGEAAKYRVKGSVREVMRGDRIFLRGTKLDVLSPGEQDLLSEDPNDRSLVLFLRAGSLTFLLTGDLGIEGEQDILAAYPQIKADVLKAGHHGSRTSTSAKWVSQLSPSISWISVGKENNYGHPHEEVIKRLEGTTLFTTAENGTVSYFFTNWFGTFRTAIP